MIMSDGDIITSYNQAKDKKAQVPILADLNVVSVPEMEMHLEALGLLERSAPTEPPPLKSKPVMDELLALELFKEGKSDLEVSAILGESITKVRDWRRRNGLLHPRGGSRPGVKRKKTQKAEAQPAPPAEISPGAPVTVRELLQILQVLDIDHPEAIVRVGQRMLQGVALHAELDRSGVARHAEVELIDGSAVSLAAAGSQSGPQ